MSATTCNVTSVTTNDLMANNSSASTSFSLSTTIFKTLVVDDNVITGKILAKILEKEFNHKVTCVMSGSDALEKLSNENFDIIFMDIDMPKQTGVETCVKIRNTTVVLEENRKIPVLAYTTNPWEESFDQAGMNGYIAKPASPAKVQSELEKIARNAL
ncbi:CheY-like superfamily [Glomus cerebriforme]|uniref:CheY-like superfamily n=1 Tax=Glomus cerebriforme TaxID=658196 RepID=A0A397TXE8_9GLOM|nr:CheY-like superfamily [Glomus cerebriforme]